MGPEFPFAGGKGSCSGHTRFFGKMPEPQARMIFSKTGGQALYVRKNTRIPLPGNGDSGLI